jgi:hypothetical protein
MCVALGIGVFIPGSRELPAVLHCSAGGSKAAVALGLPGNCGGFSTVRGCSSAFTVSAFEEDRRWKDEAEGVVEIVEIVEKEGNNVRNS